MGTLLTIVTGLISLAAMLGAIYLVEGHHPRPAGDLIRRERPKSRRH